MLMLVYNLAPTILVSDRLATYNPLFYNYNWWDGFAYQHGPHRLGLIYVFFKITSWLSDWNGRWDLYLQAIIYSLTAIAALFLKHRITKKITPSDFLLVVIFMNLNTGTTLLVNPFVHGLVPLLAIILALIYVQNNTSKQWIYLCLFAIISGFTGFGFILLPVIILVQIFTLLKNTEKQKPIFTLLPAIIASATFGFIFLTNKPNREWTKSTASLTEYYNYAITLFSNMYLTGPTDKEIWWMTIIIVGTSVFTIFAIKLGWIKLNLKLYSTVAILIGTFVLFNVLNIYGRAGMGLSNALASRYIPIGMLGAFSVYLILTSIKPAILRTTMLVLFTAILIRPQLKNEGRMRFFERRSTDFKQFESCLLENTDITPCLDLSATLNIHPANKKDVLKYKVNFLKENKLSIFKNR